MAPSLASHRRGPAGPRSIGRPPPRQVSIRRRTPPRRFGSLDQSARGDLHEHHHLLPSGQHRNRILDLGGDRGHGLPYRPHPRTRPTSSPSGRGTDVTAPSSRSAEIPGMDDGLPGPVRRVSPSGLRVTVRPTTVSLAWTCPRPGSATSAWSIASADRVHQHHALVGGSIRRRSPSARLPRTRLISSRSPRGT